MQKLRKLQAAWLESFVAAARGPKRTAVAADLGIGQTTLTKDISALEKWLGYLLIWPGSLPPRLTDDGEAFLPLAEKALEALQPVAQSRRFPSPDASQPRVKAPAKSTSRGRRLRRPLRDPLELQFSARQAALLVPPPAGGKDESDAHEPDGDDRR